MGCANISVVAFYDSHPQSNTDLTQALKIFSFVLVEITDDGQMAFKRLNV